MNYQFSYVNTPFGFTIARTSSNSSDVIFNTSSPNFNPITVPFFSSFFPCFPFLPSPLSLSPSLFLTYNKQFEDQYLELSTVLPPSPNIYGLGERVAPFRLPTSNTYTMWNRGITYPPLTSSPLLSSPLLTSTPLTYFLSSRFL